jgi:hypothetical protein
VRLAICWANWPSRSRVQSSHGVSLNIPSDGFVIIGLDELDRKQPKKTPEKQERTPLPEWPDYLYEQNARWEFKTCYVEPIYNGGKTTGDFRACRRRPDGRLEMATFPIRDEAVAWAKRYEKRSLQDRR